MSLQIWLPLNGDLHNQGLSNLQFSLANSTQTVIDDNGKIGKCATFTGAATNAIYNNTNQFNYTDNFSWSIWVNTNFTSGSTQYIFTNGRADAGGYGYGLQCSSATACTARFGNSAYPILVSSGEWTHIAFTKSNTNIKIYKNGVLYSNNTFSGTLPTYSDGNGLGLGCFHYASNIYPYYGSINDFRIYDHCLSAKEVEEIAKGLVLHYKLDTPTGLTDLGGKTYTVYNNYASSGTTGSITSISETYLGYQVYRETMRPNSSSISNFQTSLYSHGVYNSRTTFKANTK